MHLQGIKHYNDFRVHLKMFSGILLLLLYLTGNVQVESFHELFHSFERALHSQEEEKDPCHRAIYHDEKEKGCEHKTHFTPIKKCPLCHVVPFNDQHVATVDSFDPARSFETFYLSRYIISLPVLEITLPARAPPLG